MVKKRYLAAGAILLLLIGGLIPYRTVIVPRWKLQVVDENGAPYDNQFVRQFVNDYTLDFRDGEDGYTDSSGYIEFSEKSLSMNLWSRILTACKSYALLMAHGSVGVYTSVDSSGPSGYKRLDYQYGSGEPPKQLILPSEKEDQ